MKRREFLGAASAVFAQAVTGNILITPALTQWANAATGYPIDKLRAIVGANAKILVPGGPTANAFTDANKYCNLRIENPIPQVILRPANSLGVAAAVQWARENQVPFATRAGGHSYEGFSRSKGMVIDLRDMNSISVAENGVATVGAGKSLGDLYLALAKRGRAFPAGSCPGVGLAGHLLGGGYGFLARAYGLACDNLIQAEVVDAQGRILTVDANSYPDLFWGLRGGGNGQLAIVTQFVLQTHVLPNSDVRTFGKEWLGTADQLWPIFEKWQRWIKTSSRDLTSILKVSKHKSGKMSLRLVGQSIAGGTRTQTEINAFMPGIEPKKRSWIDAVKVYGGGFDANTGKFTYAQESMKGKSDYVFDGMSERGFKTLANQIGSYGSNYMVAICDSYGGAIADLRNDETAFAHRQGALFSIQYYGNFSGSGASGKLQAMRDVYAAMRPYVSGFAYVNYCDLDLQDYRTAYWGANVARLKQVKAAYDPDNFFRHAQSI